MMSKIKAMVILALFCASIGCMNRASTNTGTDQKPGIDTTKYEFSFVDSTWLFRGKPFQLGKRIAYYEQLFGPYSRAVSLMDSIYVWDSLGIMIVINKSLDEVKYPKTHLSDRIYVVFDYKYRNETIDSNLIAYKDDFERELFSKKTAKEENDARPRPFFNGSINIGGVALHKGMTTAALNENLAKVKGHLIDFTSTNAVPHVYTYCYPNTAAPFCYELRLDDKMMITDFSVDLTGDDR
jgi:hypothetical protein